MKSKEILISFVKDCLSGYSIQPVIRDGLGILRSFVVGISNGLHLQISLDEVASSLKAEFLTNREFYEAFMEEEMKTKIEIELEKFLMSPLGYYDNDIVDFFVMVVGNAFKVNVTIFQSNIEKAWIVDLKEADRYETTLFFGRSESLHLDPIIYNGIDKRCDDSDDSDIVITRVVPGSPMVIDIDVKVELKNLSEEGMFNFLIQYLVKT